MSTELSPTEREQFDESRGETAMDLVEGGAKAVNDAADLPKRLHLSDEQLDAFAQDEVAKKMLGEFESLTVDLPDEVDSEKLHRARVEAGLEGLTEAEIDRVLDEKFEQAQALHQELEKAFSSGRLGGIKYADVIVGQAEEKHCWNLLQNYQNSRQISRKASEKVRLETKLGMIPEYEKRLSILQRIKASLRLNLE